MKVRNIYRFTAAALSFLILLSTLAACGNTGDTASGTTTAQTSAASETSQTAETDSIEARALISDGLPEADYDGRTFRVLLYKDTAITEFVATEETGDIVSDSIYNRNRTIEERFNVTFDFDATRDYSVTATYVSKTVLAGEDAFDLVSSHVVSLASNALNHVLMNWYDIEYIDFTRPWWSKSNINDLTYHGTALLAVGDFAMTALSYTYCMYFDKQYAEDYALGDIYQTVLDGDWTLDKLDSLTRDIYSDVNGDNQRGSEDFYGLCFRIGSHTNAFLWSFDNPIMSLDSSGTPTLVIKTEKLNSILERLNKLCSENTGTISETDYTKALDIFKNGNCVFTLGDIGNALNYFRDIERDFGIIPYPKWDEAQQDYHTCVNGAHEAMAVPMTLTDTEFVGIITEALCAETYRSVVPAYYDTALKFKGVRDETSIGILDMIVESRVFDFGFIYDNWQGPSFMLQDLVARKSTNFESEYAKKESKITQYYESVLAALDEYSA